jgi:hypothetical protein
MVAVAVVEVKLELLLNQRGLCDRAKFSIAEGSRTSQNVDLFSLQLGYVMSLGTRLHRYIHKECVQSLSLLSLNTDKFDVNSAQSCRWIGDSTTST